ncbi:helix-hairpin-helix domain-containing protein [Clostridium sp. D2Q-14]|uniref:helix-hairpin-helix domain-containing protein n=1 Tax=Anaeromonas gelatinilytica TaxID=2683194 RepID=UPI00193B89CB|nr:helix-hairpin-helix domain-containing protein [Anaeromonas gelatinilytica]
MKTKMLSFTRKEQIVILILVSIIIGIIGFNILFRDNRDNNEDITYEEYKDTEEVEIEKDDLSLDENNIDIDSESIGEDIIVHITGAVNNPGIFTLKNGSRVNDVVKAAGGLTDEADMNRINLAKKIKDEDRIHIYKIDEEEIDDIQNENEISSDENNTDKININSAEQTELETLPDIGPVKANNIIEYRNNNRFNTIEDIMNVDRIGEKTFENIKDKITI